MRTVGEWNSQRREPHWVDVHCPASHWIETHWMYHWIADCWIASHWTAHHWIDWMKHWRTVTVRGDSNYQRRRPHWRTVTVRTVMMGE